MPASPEGHLPGPFAVRLREHDCFSGWLLDQVLLKQRPVGWGGCWDDGPLGAGWISGGLEAQITGPLAGWQVLK